MNNRYGNDYDEDYGSISFGTEREDERDGGQRGRPRQQQGLDSAARVILSLDERIREDVSDRLTDDDEVDASDITVTARDGEVTLEGTVTDRRAKNRAEDIAESVAGVSDVHNRLRTRKGILQEVGERLTGRDGNDQSGHAGEGPRR